MTSLAMTTEKGAVINAAAAEAATTTFRLRCGGFVVVNAGVAATVINESGSAVVVVNGAERIVLSSYVNSMFGSGEDESGDDDANGGAEGDRKTWVCMRSVVVTGNVELTSGNGVDSKVVVVWGGVKVNNGPPSRFSTSKTHVFGDGPRSPRSPGGPCGPAIDTN